MSSSLRKSPNRRPSHGACPTCGSARVVAVVEQVALRIRGQSIRFDKIPHEKCESCGERLFGVEASKRFDLALSLRKRNRAA